MAMRRSILGTLGITSSIVLLILVGFWFTPIGKDIRRVRRQQAKLKTPAVYEPAAKALALWCQSVDARESYIGDYAPLPTPIRVLQPTYGELGPDGGYLEFGGGFYHYAYAIRRDPAESTTELAKWSLFFCVESLTDGVLLCSIALPRSEAFSKDERVQFLEEGHNEIIAREPGNFDHYRAKICGMVSLSACEEASEACRQTIKAFPSHWWPRLVLAVLSPSDKSREAGSQTFRDWVAANPSFSNYCYLAYYCSLLGERESLCESVRAAIHCGSGGSTHGASTVSPLFMAYHMALWTDRNGCRDVAVAVCTGVVSDAEPHDPFLGHLSALCDQLAADEAGGGETGSSLLETSDDVDDFEPLAPLELERLWQCRKAIQGRRGGSS